MRFGIDYSQGRVDPPDAVGFDLCVLASSDHSAYMLGTFGLWGALLSGGDVIVAKVQILHLSKIKDQRSYLQTFGCQGNFEDYLTEEDDIFLRAKMPGWRYIDGRKGTPVVLKIEDTGGEVGQYVPE